MQFNPDGEFKWILVYEDHLTKYCILLPGKTKTAAETADKLMFIFSILAAPLILQSDNGREFVNQVLHKFSCNLVCCSFLSVFIIMVIVISNTISNMITTIVRITFIFDL